MRRLAAFGVLSALAALVASAQVIVGGGGPSGGGTSSGGASFWNGAVVPSTVVGGNGDFYLNTSTYCLYGPKANGVWPTPCVSLVGQAGAAGPPLGYVAENAANRGAPNGYAPLNSSAQVPLIDLPVIPSTQLSGVQLALGFTPLNPANNLADLSNATTARSNLGLAIGTNVEPHSALLDGFASLVNTGIVAVSGGTPSSGSLGGDVTTNGLTVTVNTVGGSTATNLHNAEVRTNTATSSNVNSTIVMRDQSGNINATQVYAGGTAVENTVNKGAANGYAPLDSSGLLPAANMPASALTATTLNNGTLSGSLQNLSASGSIATSATGAGAFMMTAGASQTPPANTVGLQAPVSVPNSFNCTWWGIPASGLVHATATTPCILSASPVDLVADTNSTPLPTSSVTYTAPYSGAVPQSQSAKNSQIVSVKDFGAQGNERFVSDAAMTAATNTLTSATAAFTPADNGKFVTVFAGSAGLAVVTYISGGTITGSTGQSCKLSGFNGGGSGANASIALTSANTIASGQLLVFTNPGSGYTGATTATLSNGTAACSGTATVGVFGFFPHAIVGTATYVNATTITLSAAAVTTVSGANMSIGTDDSAAVNAAIGALNTAGGGTLHFPPGNYLVLSQVLWSNNGATLPTQAPVRLTGDGSVWDGSWTCRDGASVATCAPNAAASMLDLRYAGTGVAKIDTRGRALLTIDNLSLEDHGDDTVPFIQTTNTTLAIHDASFVGSGMGLAASQQDAIVLGGGNTPNSFGGLSTSVFQGYGTHINHVYFSNITHGVYGRVWVNSVIISNNTWSNTCGGSEAILIDGTGDESLGNSWYGNLIELSGYQYGVTFRNSTYNYGYGNTFWDSIPALYLGGIQLAGAVAGSKENVCLGCDLGSPSFVDTAGGNSAWEYQTGNVINGTLNVAAALTMSSLSGTGNASMVLDASGNVTRSAGPPYDPLDVTQTIFDEEFPCQNAGTTQLVGTYGWSVRNVAAAPIVACDEPSSYTHGANHIGLMQVATGTANGNGGTLALDSANFGLNDQMLAAAGYTFDSQIIYLLKTADSVVPVANMQFRLGYFSPGNTSATPTHFLGIRYDTTLGDSAYQFCADTICGNTFVAPDGVSFDRLRVRLISSAEVGLTLYREGVLVVPEQTICASGCNVTATPYGGHLAPGVVIVTTSASSIRAQVTMDAWKFRATGLVR